jgi:hypothetical protein
MIFLFPDYETLQLAITSAVAPPAVSLAPVLAGVDEANRPWLEPMVKLPRTLPDLLRKLGVKTLQAQPSAGAELVNWLQAIPFQRLPQPPQVDSQAPVLFELPDANQLPVIVQEMLRLSNDRQSFRWLQEDGKAATVLLRVIGPPYYTLLRAIDREASQTPVRAYIEGPSRVWVQIGYTHPLAEKIQVSEGQMLLLRAPRDWVFLNDAPFRDIYDILQFQLPSTRLDWEAAELKEKLSVPLRLIEGDARDAELWVLHHNAIDQLDALVRDAKESLVQRLIFAVGQRDGETTIILRVRPSKQPPPQLLLDAHAYSSYLKLPNLFLPVGTRLHPALRRDAIRKLLAEDSAQINWLVPNAEQAGSFTPEYLNDDAFRPLSEWVDYVLDHDRLALTDWVQQFRFDFEPFICKEETTAERPKPPPSPRRKAVTQTQPADEDVEIVPKSEPKRDATEFKPLPSDLDQVGAAPPAQLQVELEELQKKFLTLNGGLDAAERLALWPEMAWRLAELKNPSDAAICWLNRIWEVPEHEPEVLRALVGKWAQLEKIPTKPKQLGEALDRLLFREAPSAAEARAVVAYIVWGALQAPVPQALLERLPRAQRFLEQQENSISVRAVWLGWYYLAKLAGNDALALARIRDRLLDRLIHHGLNPEHDLPHFLRAAGHHDAERLRVVRTQADRLHELALDWYRECDKSLFGSSHYVDLIFSFGFARLGETTRSRELLTLAKGAIEQRRARLLEQRESARSSESRSSSDDQRRNEEERARACADVLRADEFLFRAFSYRIEQALAGRPHAGPLPRELRSDLDRQMPINEFNRINTARYVVDAVRRDSEIIEPQEELHPYRTHEKRQSELIQELWKLEDINEPGQISSTVASLLRGGNGQAPSPEEVVMILSESLPFSSRVGESFALALLARVEPAMEKIQTAPVDQEGCRVQAQLLERAMHVAGNYGHTGLAQRLMQHFVALLERVRDHTKQVAEVARAFGQCLRMLRKLGLRDDIGKFVQQATSIMIQGRSLFQIKASNEPDGKSSNAQSTWPAALEGLLYLAGGWAYLGWHERAAEVLDAARALLLAPGDRPSRDSMNLRAYSSLAATYVDVLRHAPVDMALGRVEELFIKMRRAQEDLTTTMGFLARLHLNVIEAVVMSVVTEDFAIGPGARRWLDDDEYLVRRRIHRDHKAMKELAG